jgi:hypothetical protein
MRNNRGLAQRTRLRDVHLGNRPVRRIRPSVLVAAGTLWLGFLAARDVAAQEVTWTQVAPAPDGGRQEHAAAYDGHHMVIFGGRRANTVLGDTRIWNGTSWQLVAQNDPNAPSPRYGAAMAYDWSRQVVMLVGGSPAVGAAPTDPNVYYWNGLTWSKVVVTSGPKRLFHGLAYDGQLNSVVLFAGLDDTGAYVPLNNLLVWNGATWVPIPTSPPAGLTPRKQASLVYDFAHQRLVVYGGLTGFSFLDDAYALVSGTWTTICATCTGTIRANAAATYDSAIERVVLFGGQTSAQGTLGDMWMLDGSTWTALPPATATFPAKRAGATLVYDATRQRMILFGGEDLNAERTDTTWESFLAGEDCPKGNTQCEIPTTCANGVCCLTACTEPCHRCNLKMPLTPGGPPVGDGQCHPINLSPADTDCPAQRGCDGSCDTGKCRYPAGQSCGVCRQCAADGQCNVKPPSDSACPPAQCSRANNACFDSMKDQPGCVSLSVCGQWSDCSPPPTSTSQCATAGGCGPGGCGGGSVIPLHVTLDPAVQAKDIKVLTIVASQCENWEGANCNGENWWGNSDGGLLATGKPVTFNYHSNVGDGSDMRFVVMAHGSSSTVIALGRGQSFAQDSAPTAEICLSSIVNGLVPDNQPCPPNP